MPWQIKANYSPDCERYVNKDGQGFYTTRQSKARVFTDRSDADDMLAAVQAACPAVPFEVVEVPADGL